MTKEELIALIKKNPVSFGCGALSLALAVGLYLRSEAIPEAEDELALKSAEAQRYALNLKSSSQLKEQHEALVADNKTIESRMVRVSQYGVNTQFFYKLFADTGVKQLDFRQSTASANVPKGGKATFFPVAFSVSVQGSFAQIIDFLRQLEDGAHYCRVLNATCSGGAGNRAGPLTLSLNLELLGLP